MRVMKPTLMSTPARNILNEDDVVTYTKSIMTTAYPCYVGGPYGGVALICKQRKNTQYKELNILSDRMIGVIVQQLRYC